MSKGLEALEKLRKRKASNSDVTLIKRELKALEILSEHIIINEKNGYIEFFCDFSLPTNSKYENEEHFKEKIDLLKEVLLWNQN